MILDKLADWLTGIIWSQSILTVIALSNIFGATKDILLFYDIQSIDNSIGVITDWLWWIYLFLLISSVFWNWLRKKHFIYN